MLANESFVHLALSETRESAGERWFAGVVARLVSEPSTGRWVVLERLRSAVAWGTETRAIFGALLCLDALVAGG